VTTAGINAINVLADALVRHYTAQSLTVGVGCGGTGSCLVTDCLINATTTGINEVTQSAGIITVAGTGFAPSTVINFFNAQSGGVVKPGGFDKSGSPRIPLTLSVRRGSALQYRREQCRERYTSRR
jgi:hypothetical protein